MTKRRSTPPAWHASHRNGPHTIGPDQARELIGRASVRYVATRLDGERIARYTTLMLRGEWRTNAAVIPLVQDRLVDGLNGLVATILSGIARTAAVHEMGAAAQAVPAPTFHQGPRLCDVPGLAEEPPAPLSEPRGSAARPAGGRPRSDRRTHRMTEYEMTPERAAGLLSQGTPSPVNRREADEYVRAMQEGAWRLAEGPQQIDPGRARELISLAAVRYVAARLDGKRVAKYASLMLMGGWQPSANPIRLTEDNRLLDGLNRLLAIILSNTTQTMIIGYVPEDKRPGWHTGPRLCDVQPTDSTGS